MDTTDRGFVEHWLRVGPLLVEIERAELRAYTHAERMRDIASLLEIGAQFASLRTTSGFVEQQRLYSRGRA